MTQYKLPDNDLYKIIQFQNWLSITGEENLVNFYNDKIITNVSEFVSFFIMGNILKVNVKNRIQEVELPKYLRMAKPFNIAKFATNWNLNLKAGNANFKLYKLNKNNSEWKMLYIIGQCIVIINKDGLCVSISSDNLYKQYYFKIGYYINSTIEYSHITTFTISIKNDF